MDGVTTGPSIYVDEPQAPPPLTIEQTLAHLAIKIAEECRDKELLRQRAVAAEQQYQELAAQLEELAKQVDALGDETEEENAEEV